MTYQSVRAEREARLQGLIAEAHQLVDRAISTEGFGKKIVGTVVLFSGGNDSTILAHLMRHRATHAAHINTGIGVEATREYVRQTCLEWGLPLIEEHPPPGSTYRDLILDQGFPGPGMHWKMYHHLKERGLRKVRNGLVLQPRRQRVVFLAGRRRDESARRALVPEMERQGSVIWVSPLVNWTSLDMNTYRQMNPDCPVNEVSTNLHMSGECLCGAFAAKGELDEIAFFYPEVAEHIRALERAVREARPDLPESRCKWGWGADGPSPKKPESRVTEQLCPSCDWRWDEAQEVHAK